MSHSLVLILQTYASLLLCNFSGVDYMGETQKNVIVTDLSDIRSPLIHLPNISSFEKLRISIYILQRTSK